MLDAEHHAALDTIFANAMALHQKGELAGAESLYQRVLQIEPRHAGALHRLGASALQTRQLARSVDLITQALSIEPGNAVAHCHLGTALHLLARYDEAVESYDKAIALQPDYADAHSNRGVALVKLGRHENALQSFTDALSLVPDSAGAQLNQANALRDLGRTDEALASYDKALVLKPGHAPSWYYRGVILSRLRRHDQALASFDQAIQLNPTHADSHFERGVALSRLMRHDLALASYDRAIALNPAHASAHCNRGNSLSLLGRHDEAVASYDTAIALYPRHADAYSNRGIALSRLARHEEALASFDVAIALDPRHVDAHTNRGLALRDLQRVGEALASYDRALAIRPGHVDTIFNKSVLLLLTGRFEAGLPLYEVRKARPEHTIHRYDHARNWDGAETIAGKRLLVYWEQGFGDTIQFCRYASLVRAAGAEVTLRVQDPLVRLIATLDPAIRVVGNEAAVEDADYHCALMSLPLITGATLDNIPSAASYLAADAEAASAWDRRLGMKTRPRIGVVWNGSTINAQNRHRSIDADVFAPLLSRQFDFVALQKDECEADLAILRRQAGVAFFGEDLADFADTAALLSALDLVVTIDTSVAHLAAALGKPVWILLPYGPDWRWFLGRNDSPWYPAARLFRQPRAGDWPAVIGEVASQLQVWRDSAR